MPCFAPGRLATLLLVVSCGCHVGGSLASPPKPTPDVLAWTKREMAAFFSFNMITMASNVSDLCSVNGRFSSWLPPPDIFDPAMLDVDQWVRTAAAMGAKYAILTTKHCSGFNLWPTDIYDETGFEYMYSTRYSSFRGGSYDVVKDFVTSCAEHGIKPGIYYSFNENFYLNVAGGVVLNTPLIAGQAKVTQDQYKSIALADIRSLLTNYGELSEIWLDSGCSIPGLSEVIADLLTATQPTAVYFNGCTPNFINVVRWVGTESGLPSYPIWSTSSDCGGSHGSPSGLYFCPAESDTTLQLNDQWFWRAGHPIRSLSDLQQVYYHTVGQNTNLLLNVPANSSGLIEDTYFQRYQEFGQWIESCFSGSIVAQTQGRGYNLELKGPTDFMIFDHILISEDQTLGQLVFNFTVSALLPDSTEKLLLEGQSVGNKFIRPVTAVNASKVLLYVTGAFAEPTFLQFSVHHCDNTNNL